MSQIHFTANMKDEFDIVGNNVVISNDKIVLRKTDVNGNYASGGEYRADSFKTVARKIEQLTGFYGLKSTASACTLHYRISLDAGITWKYFKNGWHDFNGHGTGDMSYEGMVHLYFTPESSGNPTQYPSWSTELEMNEGLLTLGAGQKEVVLQILVIPTGTEQPVIENIELDIILLNDSMMTDMKRSVIEYLETYYYFNDRVVPYIDREETYQIEDFIPESDTDYVGSVGEYVHAYNLLDDPNMEEDVVLSWTPEGLITFTGIQEGNVEIQFGHRPTVHIMTEPVLQVSEDTALVLADFVLAEELSHNKREDINWNALTVMSYLERWCDVTFTVICQSRREDRSSNMETGLRNLVEDHLLYSIGTGMFMKLTDYGEVSTPSRVSDELSLTEVPLRYGRYRRISKAKEGYLAEEIETNVLLIERGSL